MLHHVLDDSVEVDLVEVASPEKLRKNPTCLKSLFDVQLPKMRSGAVIYPTLVSRTSFGANGSKDIAETIGAQNWRQCEPDGFPPTAT